MAALQGLQCNLPGQIMVHILGYLPDWSKASAKSVCRAFGGALRGFSSTPANTQHLPLHVVQQLPLPSTPQQRRKLLEERLEAGDDAGAAWLLAKTPGIIVDRQLWSCAAAAGCTTVLEGLKSSYRTAAQAAAALRPITRLLCVAGAQHGRIATLQWLVQQDPLGCPWDARSFVAAADAQHFGVLNWLVQQRQLCLFSEASIKDAVVKGQVQLLHAMKSMQPRCLQFDKHQLMLRAVENGHLAVAQLIHAQPGGLGCDLECYRDLARSNGHTCIIGWLKQLKQQETQQVAEFRAAQAAKEAAFVLKLEGDPFMRDQFPSTRSIRQLVSDKGWKGQDSSPPEKLVLQWASDGLIKIIDDRLEYLEGVERYRRIVTVVLMPEGSSITMLSEEVVRAELSDTASVSRFLDQLKQGSPVMRFASKARFRVLLDLQQPSKELQEVTEKLYIHAAAVIPWRLQHEPERIQLRWLKELETEDLEGPKASTTQRQRQSVVHKQIAAMQPADPAALADQAPEPQQSPVVTNKHRRLGKKEKAAAGASNTVDCANGGDALA